MHDTLSLYVIVGALTGLFFFVRDVVDHGDPKLSEILEDAAMGVFWPIVWIVLAGVALRALARKCLTRRG